MIHRVNKCLLLLVMLVSAAGCAVSKETIRNEWQSAVKGGSTNEYLNFIQKYPNSGYDIEVLRYLETVANKTNMYAITEFRQLILFPTDNEILQIPKKELELFMGVKNGRFIYYANGGAAIIARSQGRTVMFVLKDGVEVNEPMPSDEYIKLYGGDRFLLTYEHGMSHRLSGTLKILNFWFISDPSNPLIFRMDREKGYVYMGGAGIIITPNRKIVSLE